MKVFENVSFIFVIILVSIKKDESVIFGHPVVCQTIDIQIFLSTEALSFPLRYNYIILSVLIRFSFYFCQTKRLFSEEVFSSLVDR